MIKISDIRQFCFCPRIFYFYNFTNIQPVYPQHIALGNEFHTLQNTLFKNRTFDKLHINFDEIYENLELFGEQIYGVADLVFVCKDEVIVAEFKNQDKFYLNRGVKMQLIAYSKLASKRFNRPFYRVILLIKNHLRFKIYKISSDDLVEFNKILTQIQALMQDEIFPDSSANSAMCSQCEFLNFCDDRQ